MQKFIYHIQRAVWTGKGKHKQESKRVEINCSNFAESQEKLKSQFPGWEVSMFWPEYIPNKSRMTNV